MPPADNLLLAALSRAARRRLGAGLEPVDLAVGAVLHDASEPIRFAYFPVSALVSLVMAVDGQAAHEAGMVGREGMVGAGLVLGVLRSPMQAVVRGAGSALRIDKAGLQEALGESPVLRQSLLTYVDSLLGQVAWTAACHRLHRVEARLARWLLMTRDRASSGEFEMTQEALSGMLGVRRVGISKAASDFRRRRLIEYSRGRIRILDHAGLEAAACSCYREAPGVLPAWRPKSAGGLAAS